MTKYLLAGAAAAALTLGSGLAAAQDFKVTLSGEVKFQAAFGSQDRHAGTRTTDFRNRFRFWVNPEAKGLNGALTYGASVLVKNENSNGTTTFEASYTYLSGAFGKVYLGQLTSFNDDNGGVTKPQDWIDENDVALGYFGASNDPLYTAGTLAAWRNQTVALSGQSTKVRYDSPSIYGLKLGVAYTPTSPDSNWSFNRSTSTVGSVLDTYEIGVLFDSTDKSVADKFGAALLKASFDYEGGKNGTPGRSNYNEYQAGLQVGYAGFVIGGHYVGFGTSNALKTDTKKDSNVSYGIGAQYTITPALLAGVGYTFSQLDANDAGAGLKKASAITLGAKYTVSKGLDVYGNYGYVQTKNTTVATPAKDSGSVFEVGTVLTF